MHKHVMWAVCDDVSVVQPHLYFGLFGWGHATLKIVPMYAHLTPVQKGEGPRACHMHKQSCGRCVMSQ